MIGKNGIKTQSKEIVKTPKKNEDLSKAKLLKKVNGKSNEKKKNNTTKEKKINGTSNSNQKKSSKK